jgi:hypothetical protein
MAHTPLAVPLTPEQVTAANELHDRYLTGWQLYDQILHTLADHFPSNTDLKCVLPKAVTLNHLYATNILAIARVADYIVEVLSQEPGLPGVSAVERISCLSKAGPTARHCRSFASKYCHFFVDPDRFPVMDDFAGGALDYHLGPRGRSHYRQGPFTYLTYVADVDRIRATLHPAPTYTELDRYLWLCGQWQAFIRAKQAGKEPNINGEALRLFRRADPTATTLLRQAFADHP